MQENTQRNNRIYKETHGQTDLLQEENTDPLYQVTMGKTSENIPVYNMIVKR